MSPGSWYFLSKYQMCASCLVRPKSCPYLPRVPSSPTPARSRVGLYEGRGGGVLMGWPTIATGLSHLSFPSFVFSTQERTKSNLGFSVDHALFERETKQICYRLLLLLLFKQSPVLRSVTDGLIKHTESVSCPGEMFACLIFIFSIDPLTPLVPFVAAGDALNRRFRLLLLFFELVRPCYVCFPRFAVSIPYQLCKRSTLSYSHVLNHNTPAETCCNTLSWQ